jgi:hypothetical protein
MGYWSAWSLKHVEMMRGVWGENKEKGGDPLEAMKWVCEELDRQKNDAVPPKSKRLRHK